MEKMGAEWDEIPLLYMYVQHLYTCGGLINMAHTTNGILYKYSTNMVAQLSTHVYLAYGIMNNIWWKSSTTPPVSKKILGLTGSA